MKMASSKPPLSVRQRAHFKAKLVEKLTELFRRVRADIQESTVERVFAQDEPRDEADEAERLQLRDFQVRLDERNGQLAQAIEEALARMASGAYGICVDCGRPIEPERLELVPWTVRCADDQAAWEVRTGQSLPTL
jgi:DnaK suppressor protein